MLDELHAERFGDAWGSDVVMGRADTTGGEHVVILSAGLFDSVDDDLFNVWNDAGVMYLYAPVPQRRCQMIEVHVLGAPGKNLVADDQYSCGNGVAHCKESCPT